MTYAPPGLRGTFLVHGNDSSFPPVVDGALLFIVNGATSAPGATGNLVGVYRGNIGTSAWEQFGGNPVDCGYMRVQAYCAGQSAIFAQVHVAPGDRDFMTCSIPRTASDWSPLNVINSGETISVLLHADTLSAAATDTVDLINARLVIWDLDGSNLMEVTFIVGGFNQASGTSQPTLTQVQLIGSDLSIQSLNTIQSANGGVYNIYITAEAEWD